MNYYPHHIGDFNNATRHLTRVERALYRDLIEMYYDTEQPLPATDFDRLARRVIALTDEERGALQYVLDEFFELDGDVYRHDRCDQEIEKYRSSNAARARAGKASADARKKSKGAKKAHAPPSDTTEGEQNLTDVEQVLNTCATNQEPRTKNQEDIPNGISAPTPSAQAPPENPHSGKKLFPRLRSLAKIDFSQWPSWPSQDTMSQWLEVRKNKRATNTQKAFDALIPEIRKAQEDGLDADACLTKAVEQSWAGFKYEWWRNERRRSVGAAGLEDTVSRMTDRSWAESELKSLEG